MDPQHTPSMGLGDRGLVGKGWSEMRGGHHCVYGGRGMCQTTKHKHVWKRRRKRKLSVVSCHFPVLPHFFSLSFPFLSTSFLHLTSLLILLDQISTPSTLNRMLFCPPPLFLAAANTCVWIVCDGICG